MSQMIEIERRLSMMIEKHRHIMYLVTEERDILQNIFENMPDVLKSFIKDNKQNDRLMNVSGDCFFQVAVTNHILEDAYEYFDLKEKNYIKNKQAENIHRSDMPVFFMLNDFHIIRESSAQHFLKQFLAAAQMEEKEYGMFSVLFLISPVLKIPTGFENEIETIDVPEMDLEDMKEYLLLEAVKEYSAETKGICSQKQIWKELDSVEKARIFEAAKDFRGISRKKISEITADLKAEYGSFFGRSKGGTGNEKNLQKISEARKSIVAESKKNEAKNDSTVTMKEAQQDAVVGLKEFLTWIEDIKEEFLDEEKAFCFGNKPPKGVLLTGVPGSGKTQAAKDAAFRLGGAEGNVPLVQFRMDNLLGGLVGDSEANFKRCRKRIEALAPCIVLMDEIEKTFDTKSERGSNDVKMNILTALLDWMQENKKQIFFFATSNSVVNLKPELLRDGRFDMRFCVFMPTHDELAEIFHLHMENANRRAKGNLFADFDYRETAKEFLERITVYAESNEKNMFFTGANVENLITQANRILKKRTLQESQKHPYSRKEYVNALLEAAKGKYCQPYGVTNMKDIVEFWLSAFANQYTNAGSLDLFPFTAYDEEACEFRDADLIKPKNEYDKYMFERISSEIKKTHKKQKKQAGD